MHARIRFLGHPVHTMLIVLPMGLLVMAVVFDLFDLAGETTAWATTSFYNIVAGVAAGLVAAAFGFADWLAIPEGTRAKRIGALHGIGNALVLLLFLGIALLRWNSAAHMPGGLALFLELCGLALGAVTGWLGGELVDRLGIGVDEGANVNAPSSLTHREMHS